MDQSAMSPQESDNSSSHDLEVTKALTTTQVEQLLVLPVKEKETQNPPTLRSPSRGEVNSARHLSSKKDGIPTEVKHMILIFSSRVVVVLLVLILGQFLRSISINNPKLGTLAMILRLNTGIAVAAY